MAEEIHQILGDKVQVYRRGDTRFWYCAASIDGARYRASTEEESLPRAKTFAEDWYIDLRAQARAGTLPVATKSRTFAEAAKIFMREYETLTQGQRSERWVQGHAIRLRLHILPFCGYIPVCDFTAATGQEYRVHRMTPPTEKNPLARDNRPFKDTLPAFKTLHNEIVTMRLVLKTAERLLWINAVPNLSPVYRQSGKISPRPWFSPAEYKQLYTATRENAKTARPQEKWDAEQLHDFVLFVANSGLRPDEAANLRHRDVEIVKDAASGEVILEMEIDGKRGFGYCKTMPGAVKPYLRLLHRAKPPQSDGGEEGISRDRQLPKPDDFLFPSNHIKMFNTVLLDNGLKFDRNGKGRTAYSLRHTYICMRLMEGADIYQLAKNCRTSVEMIQKYYAVHIKDMIDAGAVNVRKTKAAKNIRLDPHFLEI